MLLIHQVVQLIVCIHVSFYKYVFNQLNDVLTKVASYWNDSFPGKRICQPTPVIERIFTEEISQCPGLARSHPSLPPVSSWLEWLCWGWGLCLFLAVNHLGQDSSSSGKPTIVNRDSVKYPPSGLQMNVSLVFPINNCLTWLFPFKSTTLISLNANSYCTATTQIPRNQVEGTCSE